MRLAYKLFSTCLLLCIFASGFSFSLKVVAEEAHPACFAKNQKVNSLLSPCIPIELQNLPYAVYQTSPGYNTARLNFNKRFVYFPIAIIAPTNEQEIQFVVSILRKYGLDFAVRSGGHCFEPGSLSPDYIIDLQNFNSILPDINAQEVYIGAGCVLGDVIKTLGAIDYAIPTGTCPGVGVTGLTMEGASGFWAAPSA